MKMILQEFKKGYRVQLKLADTDLPSRWSPKRLRVSAVKQLLVMLREQFPMDRCPAMHKDRRWYYDYRRQGNYVYFKNETDAFMFMLVGFDEKGEENGSSK